MILYCRFQSTTELKTATSTEQTEASSSTQELEVQNTTMERQTMKGDVTTGDDGVELHDAILNATTIEPTKKSLKSPECACQRNIFSGEQLGVSYQMFCQYFNTPISKIYL